MNWLFKYFQTDKKLCSVTPSDMKPEKEKEHKEHKQRKEAKKIQQLLQEIQHSRLR
jgi:hypothetical protein